jgi:hypothetical protein
MSNTSASGGYLTPAALAPFPNSLTFTQFLQTVFAGISGIPGNLVRPRWQPKPPPQPGDDTDWLAIALLNSRGDSNAFASVDVGGNNYTQRHEDIEIQCAFYGPGGYDNSTLLRDGFQVQQNLEALRLANMGFTSCSQAIRVPDLVNERWVDRMEMSVFMRREILRVYPILNFVSASGSIEAVVSGNLKTIPLKAGAPS